MSRLEAGIVTLGFFTIVLVMPPGAQATPIMQAESAEFNFEQETLITSQGPTYIFISPSPSGKQGEYQIRIDGPNIKFFHGKVGNLPYSASENGNLKSWTFTLDPKGQPHDLVVSPRRNKNDWSKTKIFDGVITGADWLHGATQNHRKNGKKVTLSAPRFFKKDPANAGKVPAPAPLTLILAALAGIRARRHRIALKRPS